jgi:hypothetical protein
MTWNMILTALVFLGASAGANCSESPNDGDNIRLSLRAM